MIKKQVKIKPPKVDTTNLRVLDAEIARCVLKQTLQLKEGFFGNGDYIVIKSNMDSFVDKNSSVPSYTTDIQWAYRIMNFMIDKNYKFNLSNIDKKQWQVTISKNSKSFSSIHEYLPLAITKSILQMNDYETKNVN